MSDTGKQRGQYRRLDELFLSVAWLPLTYQHFSSCCLPYFFVHMVASNTTDCFELLHARSLEFLGVANVHVLKMFRVKKISLPGWATKNF